MSPDRWRLIQEIFLKAAECPEEEREKFLSKACDSDPALRAEVDSLLEVHEKSSSRFMTPPRDETVAVARPEVPGWNLAGATGGECGPDEEVGPYRILRHIGRGSQGDVYLAEDTRLPRQVALKILSRSSAAAPAALLRFRREAAAVSRLDHPGICTVYEAGEANGIHFIAMRHVEGWTLAREIAMAQRRTAPGTGNGGIPLPGPSTNESGDEAGDGVDSMTPAHLSPREDVRRRVRIIEHTARALHVAHEAGLIHRDIKPGNIMVTREEEPVILDFGIARNEEGGAGTLTQSGDLVGTPAYMSPEQLQTSKAPLDRRTDVYSLGVTLYEYLTLRRPFDAPTREGLYRSILTTEPPNPRLFNPRLTSDLRVILETALEKDRDRRYQSAVELADDLRRFLAGEPLRARPAGPLVRGAKWAKRRPALAGLVGVSFAAAVFLLAFNAWFTLKLKGERDRVSAEHENSLTNLYAANIRLAQVAWKEARVGRVIEILDGEGCTPGRKDQKDLRGWEWQYLRGLCHRELLTLSNGRRFSSVVWSPDGRWVAATSLESSVVWLWNTRGGKEVRTLSGHFGRVSSIAFSSDGARLISGGEDRAVRLWDVETGHVLQCFTAARWVRGVAMSPDRRLLAAGKQLVVWVWDLSTGGFTTLSGHTGMIESVAFSSDGRRLASSGQDGTAKLWDTASWKEVLTLRGHSGQVSSVVFSPDSKMLASGSEDATVKLWDAATGQLRLTLKSHDGWARTVAFSPDGRRLASANDDQTVKLWDVASGEVMLTLKGHTQIVTSVAFSPDGRLLVSASEDGTLKLWDVSAGSQEARDLWSSYIVVNVAFSPDGRCVAMASRDGTAKLFEVASGEKMHTLRGHASEVWAVAFSPDCRTVATGSDDGTARLWDVEVGRMLRSFPGRGGPIRSVAFSPDGNSLAAAVRDGTVKLWDPGSGQELPPLKGAAAGINCVAFSPRGRRLAGGGDKAVKVWDLPSGDEVCTLQGHTQKVMSVAFSRDGRRLASASDDNSIKLWDAERGRYLRTLTGHTGGVYSVAWSPDGRRIGSGSLDSSLKLWDAESGHETLSLLESWSNVYTVAFSPDGRWLASGGQGYLRLRDASDAVTSDWSLFDSVSSPEALLAWHRQEAEAREAASEWFAAVFHLSRVIEHAPQQMDLHLRRGIAHAELGHWQAASADMTKSVELGASPAAVGRLEKMIAGKDWVLEQLRDAGAVHIQCGGGEHLSPNGTLWSADRFFNSGQPYSPEGGGGKLDSPDVRISGTDEPVLYQTGRLFPENSPTGCGYRLPLPEGSYSVSLHFAETSSQSAGHRFFDVLIEGERVLKSFEPLTIGFGAACKKQFEITVSDGFLDLELVRRAGDPLISAIEVRNLNALLGTSDTGTSPRPPEISSERSSYQDDLAKPDGPAMGWTVVSGDWKVESESLCLRKASACEGWILAGDPAIVFSDVESISFDLEFLNHPEDGIGAYGGVFFLAEDRSGRFGCKGGYAIDWIDDPARRGFHFGVWRNNGTGTWLPHDTRETGPGRCWRIELEEEAIRFFVDDQFKGEVSDCTYRSGYLGFWTYRNGTRMAIDNLNIKAATRRGTLAQVEEGR